MPKQDSNSGKPGYKEIFCRFITRKGRKIYPKKAKYFRFWVKVS